MINNKLIDQLEENLKSIRKTLKSDNWYMTDYQFHLLWTAEEQVEALIKDVIEREKAGIDNMNELKEYKKNLVK